MDGKISVRLTRKNSTGPGHSLNNSRLEDTKNHKKVRKVVEDDQEIDGMMKLLINLGEKESPREEQKQWELWGESLRGRSNL